VRSVNEGFFALSAAAKTVGLKVNEKKTKLIQVSKRPMTSSETKTGSYNFEIVQEFKYFGTIVKSDNNMDKELRNKIILCNKYYHEILSPIFSLNLGCIKHC
jgi:hypothetical protein